MECSAAYCSFSNHQLPAGHAQPVFFAPFGNSGVHQNLALCFIKIRKMAHPGDQFPRIFEHQPYCFCILGIRGKEYFFFQKFSKMFFFQKAVQRFIVSICIRCQPFPAAILLHTADMPVDIRIFFQPVQQCFFMVSHQGNDFFRTIFFLQCPDFFQHRPAIWPIIYVIAQQNQLIFPRKVCFFRAASNASRNP